MLVCHFVWVTCVFEKITTYVLHTIALEKQLQNVGRMINAIFKECKTLAKSLKDIMRPD